MFAIIIVQLIVFLSILQLGSKEGLKYQEENVSFIKHYVEKAQTNNFKMVKNALEFYILDEKSIISDLNTLKSSEYISSNVNLNSFDQNISPNETYESYKVCQQNPNPLKLINNKEGLEYNSSNFFTENNKLCQNIDISEEMRIILEIETIKEAVEAFKPNNGGNFLNLTSELLYNNGYISGFELINSTVFGAGLLDYRGTYNIGPKVLKSKKSGIYYAVYPQIINDNMGDGWYNFSNPEVDQNKFGIYTWISPELENHWLKNENILIKYDNFFTGASNLDDAVLVIF